MQGRAPFVKDSNFNATLRSKVRKILFSFRTRVNPYDLCKSEIIFQLTSLSVSMSVSIT